MNKNKHIVAVCILTFSLTNNSFCRSLTLSVPTAQWKRMAKDLAFKVDLFINGSDRALPRAPYKAIVHHVREVTPSVTAAELEDLSTQEIRGLVVDLVSKSLVYEKDDFFDAMADIRVMLLVLQQRDKNFWADFESHKELFTLHKARSVELFNL